jgi:TfoX/Sxy family transcriptional regulator of competence genes
MAYNDHLADRIRRVFEEKKVHNIEEKKMMGGLTFMVNEKMCIGIVKEDLMVRLNPELHDASILKTGARTMDFTAKPMRGYIFVNAEGVDKDADLEDWIQLALDFNEIAKASKKTKKK